MTEHDEGGGKNSKDEVEQVDQAAEQIFNEIVDSTYIQFFAFGIGNVINSQEAHGADGMGGYAYYFDRATRRMINDPARTSSPITRAFDKRGLKDGEHYFDWEYGIKQVGDMQYVFMRTTTPGADSKNALISDHRAGSFTIGVRMDVRLLHSQDLSHQASAVLGDPVKYARIVTRIMDRFAHKHIPDYTREIIDQIERHRAARPKSA